jgi:hypothetical protein
MFDFDWSDLLSLHALFAAGDWGITSIMTISGLHFAQPDRVRSLVLIFICGIIFIVAMVEGAREHKDARTAQEQGKDIKKGLDKIQDTLGANNATPDQILSAAAAKILDQQKQIDELRRGRQINNAAQERVVKELSALAPHAAIVRFVPLSNPDGENLASQLVTVLARAHWQPQPARPSTLDFTGGPSARGIHFFCNCNSEQEVPEAISILSQALKDSDIAIWREFGNDSNMERGSIGILVGAKPSDDTASEFVH